MEFGQLIMFLLGVVCLIVFFLMASNLGTIARASRNAEAILKQLLEIEKERYANGNRSQPVGNASSDEFSTYKTKI